MRLTSDDQVERTGHGLRLHRTVDPLPHLSGEPRRIDHAGLSFSPGDAIAATGAFCADRRVKSAMPHVRSVLSGSGETSRVAIGCSARDAKSPRGSLSLLADIGWSNEMAGTRTSSVASALGLSPCRALVDSLLAVPLKR